MTCVHGHKRWTGGLLMNNWRNGIIKLKVERMNELEIEQRAQKAQELFKQGYNCSQAVFASCADIYGVTDESLALRLSASFGGGMGRMRMVCGAASG